ncbi:MAG: ZIP family metal transporter [Eubacterium sp.]|nr:ZIP family metal transporter [Eubacterium sp.]
MEIAIGLLIPFLGTTLGSFCVLFMQRKLDFITERILNGFAAGVMIAASVWSLLIPSLEQSNNLGRLSFLPTAIGFWAGILFLLLLDCIIPHLHLNSDEPEGPHVNIKKTTMLILAVTIHNIPEGMAVGIVYAGWYMGNETITLSAALVLAIGIAIQNFPEGAIISMPLYANGESRKKACMFGIMSGIVEPVAGFITVFLSSAIKGAMPYLLSFAAGAMIYVVVEELIPEMSQGKHSNHGVIAFAIGFTLMMALDVSLG